MLKPSPRERWLLSGMTTVEVERRNCSAVTFDNHLADVKALVIMLTAWDSEDKARTNTYSSRSFVKQRTAHLRSVMTAEPIVITADEINCLIYSYFQDAGMFQIFSVETIIFNLQQGSIIPRLLFAMKGAFKVHPIFQNTFHVENS